VVYATASFAEPKSTIYIGGAYIDLHSSAPALHGGPSLPEPGALIEVKDASTLGFGYSYRFTPSWSLEEVLGIPPTHKTVGRGLIESFGQISTVRQVSPTLFLNYHLPAFCGNEPFAGFGLNYTHFIDLHSTQSGNAASGGPSHLSLSDSWGFAAHVGVKHAVGKRLSLIASVTYADVQSDLKVVTETSRGIIERTTHIKFNPVVYSIALGYSF
jgi:outer membrane protein